MAENAATPTPTAAQVPQAKPGERRTIQRKSLQARITHDVTIILCIYLIISGTFVFVPALAAAAGQQVMTAIRMSHRVIGLLFILVPIISAIFAPKGVAHIFKNLFHKWDDDDRTWLKRFVPYMLNVKHVHMPDQDEVKSGQRFADGMLWLCCFMMAISGVVMLLGDTVVPLSNTAMGWWRIVHDVFFVLLDIFAIAHIYLGAGIFQPYRGSARIMWKDGKVTESSALYHWGKYARRELTEGINVDVEPIPAKELARQQKN
jgi:formate dehydrogenase subunit gamma